MLAEMAEFVSCASCLLRAIMNISKLSNMMFSYGCLPYLLSILSWLIDLSESHIYMLFWSISYSWNYALDMFNCARFKSEFMLKLPYLQQILPKLTS